MFRFIYVLLGLIIMFSMEGFATPTKEEPTKKTQTTKKNIKKKNNSEAAQKKNTVRKKKEAVKKKEEVIEKAASTGKLEPKLLGTFGTWKAYQTLEDGKKVCYMASFPEKQTGNYSKRGSVYVLVAHRPHMKSYDVVSFDAGYGYKKGSKSIVEVDKKKFHLFTEQETAWCPDSQADTRLLQSMLKGSKVVVSGESAKGTKTTDTYSLDGATSAYKAMCEACNVKQG